MVFVNRENTYHHKYRPGLTNYEKKTTIPNHLMGHTILLRAVFHRRALIGAIDHWNFLTPVYGVIRNRLARCVALE